MGQLGLCRFFEHNADIEILGVYTNNPKAGVLNRIKDFGLEGVIFDRDSFVNGILLDEIKSLARSNNPDLLAAYFSGDAAASAISVAKSAYRPKITLNALAGSSRGQTFGIGDSDQLALAARVSVPIFTSGMTIAPAPTCVPSPIST